MGNNLSIEAPEFDEIRAGNKNALADAIILLWKVANSEAQDRRVGVRAAIERMEKKYYINSPAANQNNYDTKFSTILRFDGASAINITGLRARVEGALVLGIVLGTGTITFKHNDGASEATNRIINQSGADLAVATNRAVLYGYLNARWREFKWA